LFVKIQIDLGDFQQKCVDSRKATKIDRELRKSMRPWRPATGGELAGGKERKRERE
jgi:hypothetical protein